MISQNVLLGISLFCMLVATPNTDFNPTIKLNLTHSTDFVDLHTKSLCKEEKTKFHIQKL